MLIIDLQFFQVVVARYIFDCIHAQCRLPVNNYSVGGKSFLRKYSGRLKLHPVDDHGHVRVANALIIIAPTQSALHTPMNKAIAAPPAPSDIRFVDLRAKLRASNNNHNSLPTPPQSRNVSFNITQGPSGDGNDVRGKRGRSDATQLYGFSLKFMFLLINDSALSDAMVKRARQI